MAASAPVEPAILLDRPSEGVVRITLNRPKALNALNVNLLFGLSAALRTVQSDSSTRVIILEGAGDRSFCTGEDLKESLNPRTGSVQELRDSLDQLQELTRLTSMARCVVIAAVQGYAVGGGAEIALGADFVIGGPATKFRFPEILLGFATTGGINLRLSHLVGLLKAKQLLLTGKWVEANEALKIGLLSEIAKDPKARALTLAKELAALPAASVAASKMLLERSLFPNMEPCLQDEIHVAHWCFSQDGASKTFSDFAARKAPSKAINSTAGAAPRDINSAFSRAVVQFPNRIFFRFAGKDLTFREFDAIVAAVSGGLRGAGIGSGDRVLGMMANSVEMAALWLAANRLGAVWVPVNTELRSVTLRHVVEAAEPKLAIVDQRLWPVLQPLDVLSPSVVYINGSRDAYEGVKSLSAILSSESQVHESVAVTPGTTAAMLYTSGTTGKSKPCILSHEYFVIEAQALIDSCNLRPEDVLYCPFPLFHADATALTVMPAILLGAVAAISVRFTATRFWDEIRACKATVYDFMGATLALTYKQPPSPGDREHNVRLAWGVPVPSFAQDYEQRFGHPLVTLYGSIESGIPIIQDLTRPLPPGSCGRLRPGYQMRITDDVGEEVPPGTPGNLLLRNDKPNAFFQGYFHNPASSAASFAGLWLNTGDLAKVDEEGNVYFVGRVKDVVRRRGENVNASEVEEEFFQHPDIVIAAAYGVPSRLGAGTEEDLKVAVQLRPGSTLDEKAIWEWSAGRMARFQVPSIVQIVEGFQKTPTGKIEKGKLSAEGGVEFDIRQYKAATA
ncbi:hypothetical protein AbraIFM66951_005984 [Aspergillus brasiliensis]|uniref:AMP-dependent synthetase/ligase domain-containing protein n=1 Tax=Aspergillus brasiliensis TaxID=319629 RepID=A0A9W6DSR1_9EURO|nr:hypothetical protein AbraCBS73388_005010 [Aspergillus brasiliensis]GKZ51528.1 hypothetical protein AbraIFM66951_005984 [Aspergillus brasiliensis]